MALLSTKDPSEVVRLSFDFTALAAPGAVIVSATTQLALHAGTQLQNLSGLLIGSPAIASPVVSQQLGGGVLGSIYRVRCTATFDDGSVYALSGDVPINTVFGV